MNGIIVIDKPKDWTSRDVVNKVMHHLNIRKIGHLGTLDPLATGVLVLLVGEAVKVNDLILDDSKEYVATVKTGILTDTLDITGNVLEERENDLNKEDLEKCLSSFLGKSIQEVPKYSSVKVNGKHLYEYARNNIEVEIPKKEIEIFDIELINFKNDEFTFKVKVSKGTYIRSLIRDIGNKLNILCTMKELRRTKQAMFDIDDSVTLEEFLKDNYKVFDIKDSLIGYNFITVDSFLEKKISNGVKLENRYDTEYVIFQNESDKLLAIYKKDHDEMKAYKVFNIANNN